MVHLGVDFVPDVKPAVHLSGDPDVGIQTVSLVDPTAAPPGHSTIGIITLLPHAEAERWFPADEADSWKQWRRSPEYTGRKTALGDRMIAAAEKIIPCLSSHIVYRRREPGYVFTLLLDERGGHLRSIAGRSAQGRQEPGTRTRRCRERRPMAPVSKRP
jgi:phytoene dehydrogenase-like protein